MQSEISLQTTFISSPNIALIKYWGKYDQDSIIPWNDNIGLTLNADDISTVTKIVFERVEDNYLELNGQGHPISTRVRRILERVKSTVKNKC